MGFVLPRAALFDLDDTLLANDMDVFIPAYFDLLRRYARYAFDGELLVGALREGIVAMMSSPGRRNADVFWEHFAPRLGGRREQLEPFFARFYENEFAKLQQCTQPVPGARDVVDWFRTRGVRLVLATNPVYPHSAIVQRLRWAGFEPEEFELLTTYENMHTTKPDVGYYREILDWLGLAATEVVMVGNDPVNDIEPAVAAGIRTYHVCTSSEGPRLQEAQLSGSLRQWYEDLCNGES